ncbi:peptide ABC transporter permease [Anoxybacter fermentans]|uniref:Peptide ABC transporter permease n=1 Tax=Anoxybacter fermentans TaxID=1323375 RepID=A0A3S9T1R9_9FIRM|nr:ABC transporter permease [Anoxybacter fermentans]AZR74470.1 peptide ABC transporter permease [Anoxybacter fermentans]
MYSYIVKRILFLIPILLGVSFLVFLMIHLVPGDPAVVMLGEKATPEMLEMVREELGLNDPMLVQYFRFLKRLLHLDLGRAIISNVPVSEEIGQRFPATAELTFFSMLFAVIVGIPVGILAACKQNSIFDNISMLVALFGVSMPIFWLGLMLIWLFSVKLGWLPPSARITVGVELKRVTNLYVLDSLLTGNFKALKDVLSHLVLPSLALGTIPMAIIARMTRSSMLEVLRQDYIRTAYAKGLHSRVVVYKHAFKNALIPIVTVVGLQFGLLLGGAVLTETIFSWPGIGKLSYDAIMARDFPLVQGAVLVISMSFVFINLIVDITYSFIDPRIHYS